MAASAEWVSDTVVDLGKHIFVFSQLWSVSPVEFLIVCKPFRTIDAKTPVGYVLIQPIPIAIALKSRYKKALSGRKSA